MHTTWQTWRMAFHHVAITTRDLEASNRFYTDAMGFELVKVDVIPFLEGGWARHLFYDTGNGELIALWDLHYDDPPAFNRDLENQMNMVEAMTSAGPHGPQVPPGTYTLKLTADGRTYTQSVVVHNDPRVGESAATLSALKSQHALTLLAYQGMKDSYSGNEEVAAARAQLAPMLQAPSTQTSPGAQALSQRARYQAVDIRRRGRRTRRPRRRRLRWWSRRRRARRDAVLHRAEQQLQHHGQHDAGRPRHGAHAGSDRYLGERLQELQHHGDGVEEGTDGGSGGVRRAVDEK